MKVYLSGAITDNPNFEEEFKHAEELLTKLGYEVVNPTIISWAAKYFDYADFMIISLQLLKKCDAIYFLGSWAKSDGAKIEKIVAKKMGLKVIHERYMGLTNPNRRKKTKAQETIF